MEDYIYCNVCDINIRKFDLNTHLDSDVHRENLFKELPTYNLEEYDEEEISESTNFDISETRSNFNNKFNTWQIDYKIKINSDVDLDDLNDIFDEMIRTIKQRTLFREGDKMNLTILND
jgi:hypothetical protein